MGRLRRRAFLPALLVAACCCSAVLLAACQQQPVSVDGLTTTDAPSTGSGAPPPASAAATSMPATSTAASPSAATAATPAAATPSALAAPIDRAAFRTVATCSSLVRLPRRSRSSFLPSSPSSSSRNKTSSSPLPLRPSVKALNATLEMDVTPSYSSVWRGRDGNVGGWRPGRSRLNISGLIGPGAGAAAPLAVSARLHPLPCLPDGVAMFGPLAYSASTAYRHNSEGTETDAAAGGGGQPAEILGLKVSAPGPAGGPPRSSPPPASQVAGSATFPFLVDYDASGSVVLYADETAAGGDGGGGGGTSPVPLACCNLSPPPPDFPEEWSAVIEANVRDKGYTMVVRQLYSASNKKVRLDVHSLGNDRVVVQDYNKGTATFIDGPNSTHPFGSCDVVKFDELDGGGDAAAGASSSSFGGGGGGGGSGGENKKAKNSTNAAADGSAPVAPGFSSSSSSSKDRKKDAFLPTAAALAFAPGGGAARAKFVPSAAFDVRGIPVETWQHRVEEPSSNSSYDLLYFFPVNAWLASGEDYHRLLKAIVVNGTQGGQRVYQEFHFVDFRPYGNGDGGSGAGSANGTGVPAEAFDPCEIAPGGAGCGCDKKKKEAGTGSGKAAAAAADFAAFQAGGVSPGVGSGGSPSDPFYSRRQQEPMGLLPSQVGSYVFFLFLGLVAGLLGAFGVPALVGCCCSGRRRRRSFGRFDEGNGGCGGAPTSAVTSAA